MNPDEIFFLYKITGSTAQTQNHLEIQTRVFDWPTQRLWGLVCAAMFLQQPRADKLNTDSKQPLVFPVAVTVSPAHFSLIRDQFVRCDSDYCRESSVSLHQSSRDTNWSDEQKWNWKMQQIWDQIPQIPGLCVPSWTFKTLSVWTAVLVWPCLSVTWWLSSLLQFRLNSHVQRINDRTFLYYQVWRWTDRRSLL